MTPGKRFLIGGGGALMPVMVSILAVDIATIIDSESDLTTGNVIGFFVRYLILFIVGGVVAWLHEDETKPFKLFELGIAAPGLIGDVWSGITGRVYREVNSRRASAVEPGEAVTGDARSEAQALRRELESEQAQRRAERERVERLEAEAAAARARVDHLERELEETRSTPVR